MLTSSIFMMVMIAISASAQSDTTGWGQNSRFNRMYDSKTVTEINGKITKIESVAPMRGMSTGVHITIRSEGQDHSVHLGPKWFLDNQSLELRENDQISVKGSKVTFEGSPAIIAREVTKGTDVLKLRDESGVPVWSRRRAR